MSATDTAIVDVRNERLRQDTLHGEGSIGQRRDPCYALAILMEEVGELATAIMQLKDAAEDLPNDPESIEVPLYQMRQEAVEVAACAVAIIEAIDNDQYP